MKQGLFDPIPKEVVTSANNTIGIITSPTGAALHDILHILKRRDPRLHVIIYPCTVQGTGAVPTSCHAIRIANQRKECDVLLLRRGGRSEEDLWCFNDEQLARHIFESRIPIISAVGHETDVTIADPRTPTPSAAAELVSRDRSAHLSA